MSIGRKRNGVIRLPIVDIDFALLVLKDPRTAKLMFGARRQVSLKATQMLESAKRDQIDGQVRLDTKDLGLLLQALALTVEWTTDIAHTWFDDDEQI